MIWALPAQGRAEVFPEISVFIDADLAFVTKAGGEAKAQKFIQELIAKVDAIYRTQLGLTVRLAGLHLWTTADPFIRTSQSSFLASFADYSESNYRPVYSYDAAQLLTGAGMGGEGG